MACSSSSVNKRFSEMIEDDDIKKMRYAKGTVYQTNLAKKLFNDYITLKCHVIDKNSLTFKESLDSVIHDFLLVVRKEDGEQYSISGFNGLYFALARSIMDDYSVDLIKDTAFVKVRNARKVVKGILKKCGLGHVTHTDVISDEDLEKISSFDTSTPLTLQLKTWFLLQFHLALRGKENCHDMMKEDLLFGAEDGVQYIELRDMLTKNHRGETYDKSTSSKMFSTIDSNCPVSTVKYYLSKLNPDNKFLWQRPKKKYLESSPIWYDNQKIGVNSVSKFMKTLSALSKLSKVYTNHSPRATCITILGRTYQDSDVASHSGHKSLSAMAIYKRTSESMKKNMSHTLSSTMTTTHQEANAVNTTILEEPTSATVNNDTNIAHNQCCLSIGAENLPDDFLEFNQFLNRLEEEQVAMSIAQNDADFARESSPVAMPHENKLNQSLAEPSGFNNCKCFFNGCTFNFR